MTDQELMDMAKKAAEYAYVPYSKFPVGAALECSDGTIFTGCNVENAAYGDTICAERTAAVKAVSSGHRDFVRIAIWGNSKEYCYPCGSCRQFLQEFSKHMTVLCAKGDGSFVSHKLSEMMPFFFDFCSHRKRTPRRTRYEKENSCGASVRVPARAGAHRSGVCRVPGRSGG